MFCSAFKLSDICYCSQIKILYMQFHNFTFHHLYFNSLPSIFFSLGWVGSSCRTIALTIGVPNIYLSKLPWACAGELFPSVSLRSSPGMLRISWVPGSDWFLISCSSRGSRTRLCPASPRHPRAVLRGASLLCGIKCQLVAESWSLNFHQPQRLKLSVPPSSAASLFLELHLLSMQIFLKGKWFLPPKSFSCLIDGCCAKLINFM